MDTFCIRYQFNKITYVNFKHDNSSQMTVISEKLTDSLIRISKKVMSSFICFEFNPTTQFRTFIILTQHW